MSHPVAPKPTGAAMALVVVITAAQAQHDREEKP